MGRLKQGLDYFPLSTDFMHDRIVRRVMKREGKIMYERAYQLHLDEAVPLHAMFG